MRSAVVLALLFALGCGTAAYADCGRAARGQTVTLFGGADDPDVLVWDSRDRLMQYESGSVDTRRFLLPHAVLMRPGVRVKVYSCVSNIVRPKFQTTTEDAVAVELHGSRLRYGWVTSSDIQQFSR